MEKLKPRDQILYPDERNQNFSFDFDRLYDEVVSIELPPTVPEGVRSYFATIQNVCIYAWYAYSFYALVEFLSYTAIEMALRERLKLEDPKKRWGLGKLLSQALKMGLIDGNGFSHIRRMRENQKLFSDVPDTSLPRADNYGAVLKETLPKLRNDYAHPQIHNIRAPAHARFALRFAADFINQLFEPQESRGSAS